MTFTSMGLRNGLQAQQFPIPVTIKEDYNFLVPFGKTPKTLRAELAVFTSAVPSIQSAMYGFFNFDTIKGEMPSAKELSALGAPEVAYILDGKIFEIHYKIDESYDTLEVKDTENWVFRKLRDMPNLLNSSIGFDLSKTLIIQAAKDSLIDRLRALFSFFSRDEGLEEAEAIKLSFEVLDALMLDKASENPLVSKYCKRIQEITRFENVPPSTLAEAYEQFGISEHAKRKSGVVYTPAWLAKFAVSQIPSNIITDKSISFSDPACGSGTFLVSLIERLATGNSIESIISMDLPGRVHGQDIDSLAVYITRLALNYISQNIGLGYQSWDIRIGDSTSTPINTNWIIGNLPFGYRSHGARDLSNVILENILSKKIMGFNLIMPESFSYSIDAISSRKMLLNNYSINEIYIIPDGTYKSAAERTILIEAEFGQNNYYRLRALSAKRKYRYQAGFKPIDFITLQPKSNENISLPISPFEYLIKNLDLPDRHLRDDFFTRTGTKIYGSAERIAASDAKRIKMLSDPKRFWDLELDNKEFLDDVPDDKTLYYNKGPWEIITDPKLIVRATVNPKYRARLASYLDTDSLAFTDKFTGIWNRTNSPLMLKMLGIYLQTDFVVAWFRANNPNRKLRNYIIDSLPIPNFNSKEWQIFLDSRFALKFFTAPVNQNDSLLATERYKLYTEILKLANHIVNKEFNINEDIAEALKLIDFPDDTTSIISRVRELQLAEEYRSHSKNLSSLDQDFLSYSGVELIGDKN